MDVINIKSESREIMIHAAFNAAQARIEQLENALRNMLALWDKYYQELPVEKYPEIENEEFGHAYSARKALNHKEVNNAG